MPKIFSFMNAVVVTLIPSRVFACSVCFGGDQGSLTGIKFAILFMLGILLFVLTGVVAFIINLWRRSHKTLTPHR